MFETSLIDPGAKDGVFFRETAGKSKDVFCQWLKLESSEPRGGVKEETRKRSEARLH
jgi:hypothetical protein